MLQFFLYFSILRKSAAGRNESNNRKRLASLVFNYHAEKAPFKYIILIFTFIIMHLKNRCDSFGNRPVTASSQNRRAGGGRIRSGSTGNKPQTVNSQPRSSTITLRIREPPHQQQSQQHNFKHNAETKIA